MTMPLPAELPALRKGPWTSAHLVRWCAAQQNWDRIHYDQAYAQREAGLPERLVNGALKQHLLAQFVERALPAGWLVRLDFRFSGPDFVGDTLEVRGHVTSLSPALGGPVASLALAIHNLERDAVTTSATALVHLPDGSAHARLQCALPPDYEALSAGGEGVELVHRFGLELGGLLERIESEYPVDLSRLRLFADAVGGMAPRHFDPAEAAREGFPAPPAPPLFPIHALELWPGRRPLATDAAAMGREGVAEVGRSVGARLGLPPQKMVNGGASIRVHGHACAGEVVVAESRLASLAVRPQARSGPLVAIKTLNRYETVGGRPLLDELVSIVYRNVRL
jgi:acyl dehydratase